MLDADGFQENVEQVVRTHRTRVLRRLQRIDL
jgi:hypothetical protein